MRKILDTTQRLSDVFDAAHRTASEIQFHERLLDGGFTAPIVLDDGGIQRLLSKLGNRQRYLTSLGEDPELILARLVVAALFYLRTTLGVDQSIGLRIQKTVQRFLNRARHGTVEMVLDPLCVEPDDIVQIAERRNVRLRNRPILCHWWSSVRLMVEVMPAITFSRFGDGS